MTGALLAHVRHERGEAEVDQVLRAANDLRPLEELEDPANWSSYEQTRRLFDAARTVTGDDEIGRRVGESILARFASSEVVELLRSLERPSEVLRVIAEVATKQSTITTMACIESDERHALVSAKTASTVRREPMFCDYTAGVLSAMPTIFGMAPGTVVEPECQVRGDTQCLYRVTWDPNTATDAAARVHFLSAQVAALTNRFEALEAMASELASVGDVEQALSMIAARAGVAIRAPQFLLAVQLPREDRLRIHHIGLLDHEVARYAAEVLEDSPDDHGGSRLIVDVRSSGHFFGRIAALHPEGHRFLSEERRLFEAYAGHAAAALQTATAFAEARERATTIGALFDLATVLSEVGTVEEVADRLERAAPKVVDCSQARVFIWHPQDSYLVSGRRSVHGDAIGPQPEDPNQVGVIATDESLVERLLHDPKPMSLGDFANAARMTETARVIGFETGVVVPIVARRRLFGLLVVNHESPLFDTPVSDVGQSRFDGVARIAATAFDNARLMEEIRHQAGHDSLTGLPNSRSLEELCMLTLANARRQGQSVALMFVDLDHFKNVNDELGHHTGDAVLVEVASRLRIAIRAGDCAARLGGDEFAILMPGANDRSDLALIAERIIRHIEEPIRVARSPHRCRSERPATRSWAWRS